MAFQDRDALVLDALSILKDAPLHSKPALEDGVHLRWFVGEGRGFPLRGGYYLFRRRVGGETPSCLIPLLKDVEEAAVGSVAVWPTAIGTLSVVNGRLLRPVPPLTRDANQIGGFRVDAEGGLRFALPPGVTTRQFDLRVRYVVPPTSFSFAVQVSASAGSTPVYVDLLSPNAFGPDGLFTVHRTAAMDSLELIPILPPSSADPWWLLVLDICYVPDGVVTSLTEAPASETPSVATPRRGRLYDQWEAIPNLTSVITLPLTHPAYPASPGAESINTSMATAKARLRYGQWSEAFPAATRAPGPGAVSLTNGSAIVAGSGTGWTADLAGKSICVPRGGADPTGYTVMSVLAPDRVVVSRAYSGPSQSHTPYDLVEGDDFVDLHDRVACLLNAPNDMRAATAPPMLDQGTVAGGKYVRVVAAGSAIHGIGTQWTASLTGCDIEIGPTWSKAGYFTKSQRYRIQSVNSASQITLDRPFAGPISSIPPTRADYRIVVRAGGDPQDTNGPAFEFKPMDLLELASLMPAYAQALGLYWIDTAVAAGDVFDYIVIADRDDQFGHRPDNALRWLNGAPDFSGDAVDGYIVMGVKHSGSPALPAPGSMALFRLPTGGSRISIEHPNRADSDVGLSVTDAASWKNANPGQPTPVMMNLWRLARGTDAKHLLSVGNLGAYQDVGMMVPSVRDPVPGLKLPAGWPPDPIHFVDAGSDGTGLDVGWYTYRANSIDIFGRWSPTSAPIPWTVSGPPPPVGDAIHLEDRTAPPPPAGVLAWVLDDADPYLLRDPAYNSWKSSFGTSPLSVGLRIQWRWPWPHRNQGPDLREFRIYFQSKPLNARTGRVTSVAPAAGQPTRSLVTLDLSALDTSPPSAYTNATLQAGNRSFPIVASLGGATVQLTVNNGGPLHDEAPDSNVEAAIVIPSGHPLHKDLLDPRNWERWLAAVPENLQGTRHEVEMVEDPAVTTFDDPENTFTGVQATWNGSAFVLKEIPAGHSLGAVRPGIDVLALASDEPPAYTVVGIRNVQGPGLQVVPLQDPGLSTGTTYQWRLGPATPGLQGIGGKWNVASRQLALDGNPDVSNVHAGTDLAYVPTAGASPADPANLSFYFTVEAVDAASHTVTLNGTSAQLSALAIGAPAASLPWKIGRPVRYYEVFLPDPRVSAVTLAPNLDTSALLIPDPTQPIAYGTVGVSSADWRDEVDDQYLPARNRKGNESWLSGPAPVFRVLRATPPTPSYAWNVTRLYATKANYRAESFFTVRWNKPGTGPYFAHVLRAMGSSLFLAHWNGAVAVSIPFGAAPPVIKAEIQAFVSTFDAHKTQYAVFKALADDANAQREYAGAANLYDQLSDAGLWWLAGLSELADAYMQVTINLLSLADPANADRLGPDDDPATFPGPNPAVCAYTDTLDGRSTNRYFYRVMLLDGAQNRGGVGDPTPPVYLPKVVPPRTPVVTRVLAGEQQITIQWAHNREPDLAGYRVYRSEDAERAKDVRSMDLAATIARSDVDDADPSAEWVDSTNLIGGRKYYYRLAATDTSGNESEPTRVHVGVAVDTRVPPPPMWTEQTWLLRRHTDGGFIDWPADGVVPAGYHPVLRLGWQCETPEPQFVVRRLREPERRWMEPNLAVIRRNATVPPTFSLLDDDVDPERPSAYRVKVRSSSGVWSAEDALIAVSRPGPETP